MIIHIGDKKIRPSITVTEAMPTEKIGRDKKAYYVLVLKGKLDVGEEAKEVILYSSTSGSFFMYKTPISFRFSFNSPINNLLKMAKVSHYKELAGVKLPITTEGNGWVVDFWEA